MIYGNTLHTLKVKRPEMVPQEIIILHDTSRRYNICSLCINKQKLCFFLVFKSLIESNKALLIIESTKKS